MVSLRAKPRLWMPIMPLKPSRPMAGQRRKMLGRLCGLRRLRAWASDAVPESEMKQKPLDLCDKRDQCSPSYAHPVAHRTSNMVDRLMRFLDRAFFNAQYFHGLLESAENRVRALALLWNFCPSSPETVKKDGGQSSPAERLNGKCYADNWLENLLVSGSMNGVEQDPQNPL